MTVIDTGSGNGAIPLRPVRLTTCSYENTYVEVRNQPPAVGLTTTTLPLAGYPQNPENPIQPKGANHDDNETNEPDGCQPNPANSQIPQSLLRRHPP